MRYRASRDPLLKLVCQAAASSRGQVWLVGGPVRDAALDKPSKDVDLASGLGTARLVPALSAIFGTRGYRFRKRGVTTWRWMSGAVAVDCVDASRRGIDADLRRRELTINAIAYDLLEGKIVDPVRGLADLRAKKLCLPAPGVIEDDPLRALRVARFLAELDGFRADRKTRRAAISVAPTLRRAAVERVREELGKLLGADRPEIGLDALVDLGLLGPILGELEPMRSCVAGQDRPDVWTHTRDAVARCRVGARYPGAFALRQPGALQRLRWSLLLHDISKPETFSRREDGRPSFHAHEVLGARRADRLLRRLRLPKDERRRICRLILNHLRPGHLADAGPTPRGLRRLVRDLDDDLPLLVVHSACDALASGSPDARRRWSRLRRVLINLLDIWKRRERQPLATLVDGRDLMRALDFEPGPRIGRLLERIRNAQEDGTIRTRRQALDFARRHGEDPEA